MLIEAKNLYRELNRFYCNPDSDEFFYLLEKNIERIKQPLKNKVIYFIIFFI